MIEVRTPAAPVETPARPKTPREVGAHAARYIEEHGWTQHEYRNADGRVCMHGAVGAITGWSDDGNRLYERTTVALADAIGTFTTIGWNDAPGRTRDEVIAALRSIR